MQLLSDNDKGHGACQKTDVATSFYGHVIQPEHKVRKISLDPRTMTDGSRSEEVEELWDHHCSSEVQLGNVWHQPNRQPRQDGE